MKRLSLLVVDFDRTVTDKELRIDESCLSQIGELAESGVHTTLVTGRKRLFVDDIVRSYPATFRSVVCENGCMAFFDDSWTMLSNFETRGAIMRRLREFDIPFDHGDCIISTESLSVEEVDSMLSDISGWHAAVNVDSVMIIPPDTDKGVGIRWIQSHTGIPKSETAGIGDGENDMVMRENCDLFGAPASAVDSLKEVADFVSNYSYSRGTIDFIAQLRENLTLPSTMRK